VFAQFFSQGARMSALPSKRLEGLGKGLAGRIMDYAEVAPERRHVWQNWHCWYSDGTSVGVLLAKDLGPDCSLIVSPNTPWF
jgi:hypothetical protein